MHIKKGFILHDICGENIIIAEGKENIDFNNLINMNSTSAFLWKSVKDKEFLPEDLGNLLLNNYEVDQKTAYKDARDIVGEWEKAGIVEG